MSDFNLAVDYAQKIWICWCKHYKNAHLEKTGCLIDECTCKKYLHRPCFRIASQTDKLNHFLMPMHAENMWELVLDKKVKGISYDINPAKKIIQAIRPLEGPEFRVGKMVFGYKIIALFKEKGRHRKHFIYMIAKNLKRKRTKKDVKQQEYEF